jgi:RNA polymerase sigma-70 factor, ECF subfamily
VDTTALPQYASLTDEELIERCKSCSNATASNELFGELVRRYQLRIVRWCLRFTGDRECTADLTQEILFRAYRSFNRFRGDSRFSTWMYVIARNHCRSAVKKRASEPSSVDQEVAAAVPDTRSTAVYASIERQHGIERKLRWITQVLTSTEAKIMMLHYGQEVPLAAITRSLGLSNRSGAKAYIVSARRKISSAIRTGKASELSGLLRVA